MTFNLREKIFESSSRTDHLSCCAEHKFRKRLFWGLRSRLTAEQCAWPISIVLCSSRAEQHEQFDYKTLSICLMVLNFLC